MWRIVRYTIADREGIAKEQELFSAVVDLRLDVKRDVCNAMRLKVGWKA